MINLTLTRPLAVIDLETTSADVKTARIVEVSVLRFEPMGSPVLAVAEVAGQPHRAANGFHKTRRVNPGIPIPREATDIHGIADADVSACPPFGAIARGLLDFLAGCDLCGFNLKRFDVKVLCNEFARAGLEFDLTGRAIIDVCEIFHKREPRNLEAAHWFYCGAALAKGIAHTAAGDVSATASILDAMLSKYPDLPRESDKLAAAFVDPEALDVAGCFACRKGVIVFAFGKHTGKPITEERPYLHWMLDADFLPDAKRIAREALQPQPAKE